MITLEVQARDAKTAAEDIRSSGLTPAVFYGPKEAATPISIKTQEFARVFKSAGETTIVKLAGIGEDKDTLIRDVQFHPVLNTPIHADFYVLEKGKKISISVPLEFTGEAPAEKLGHIVTKVLHEVEIEVAAAELPHHLLVDLSKLENAGDQILAKDIPLPKSAELMTSPEEVVVSITEFEEEAPREAASTEAAAPAATPEA